MNKYQTVERLFFTIPETAEAKNGQKAQNFTFLTWCISQHIAVMELHVS